MLEKEYSEASDAGRGLGPPETTSGKEGYYAIGTDTIENTTYEVKENAKVVGPLVDSTITDRYNSNPLDEIPDTATRRNTIRMSDDL